MKKLSSKVKKWKQKLIREYGIDDEGGLILLQNAMESLDLVNQCQEVIDQEGLTITDRFDQVKAHPLLSVQRDARSAFLQSMKALNLDVIPTNDIGRPPGT